MLRPPSSTGFYWFVFCSKVQEGKYFSDIRRRTSSSIYSAELTITGYSTLSLQMWRWNVSFFVSWSWGTRNSVNSACVVFSTIWQCVYKKESINKSIFWNLTFTFFNCLSMVCQTHMKLPPDLRSCSSCYFDSGLLKNKLCVPVLAHESTTQPSPSKTNLKWES